MAHRSDVDGDIQHLKEKLRAKGSGSSTADPNPAARHLRKRLKRAQRKRRKLVLRRQHAGQKRQATT